MSEQLIQTPCAFGDNGNFLLERELGSGGMGGVYMGRDKMLDRPVAVKVMQKELGADAEFVEKFKREAQSAAKLIHPNIAQVYSYGICDGMPYIAMELAAGGSLYSIMNANPGKTDVARVIKICQQVAQALQCASDQGFVHGDVKPENVLLDSNGNAKLVDFGLAAMQKDTDEIWGTPYYISPEKVRKEPVDFRADMYSLGGTLYHALTGVAPFEGEDSIAVVKKRFEGLPKKPSEIRSDLTPAIDNLVMTMLALDKENRYPSFEALLEAFKSVLTTGLTAKLPTSAAPAPKTAKPAAGAKRMTVRGRRMATMKRPGTTIKKKIEGEEGNEGALDETEKPASEDDEDEEGGGNLGLKVAGVVVGSILLIGGVIGGLVWYQIADKKARAAEEQAQITAGIGKARSAIADTMTKAGKYADDFDAFAAKATAEADQSMTELMKLVPQEHWAELKPGPTKALLEAIAMTNETPKAAEAPAPVAATTNAVVATTNGTAVAATTNAPTATAKAAAAQKAGEAKKDETKEEEKPAVSPIISDAILKMSEIWGLAYDCQAAAIRVRHSIKGVLEKAREADAVNASDRAGMDALANLSRTVVDLFEQVKGSKDAENVAKWIPLIRKKGESLLTQTAKRLRIEKLESDRKAKAEAAAAAEKERQEKLAEEKKAKVEEETSAVAAKFDAIVAQGCIRQLDWKSALRQLENTRSEMTTPEGQLACDLEIRKINDMKKVQDILIKNMRNFTFKKSKSKLRGAKVVSVNEKEIQLERGKEKLKLTWQKFFSSHFSNIIEVFNQFIFNGRKNAGLSQRDVADAMTGGALLLNIVCAEEASASTLAEKMAKESVAQFPEYLQTAQKIFPEIKFEGSEE